MVSYSKVEITDIFVAPNTLLEVAVPTRLPPTQQSPCLLAPLQRYSLLVGTPYTKPPPTSLMSRVVVSPNSSPVVLLSREQQLSSKRC